jgi:hypothetical protein
MSLIDWVIPIAIMGAVASVAAVVSAVYQAMAEEEESDGE